MQTHWTYVSFALSHRNGTELLNSLLIFPGTPLKLNGAPGNIQGNRDCKDDTFRFRYKMKYDTPDQGYAWVVMTACFALQMLISSSFATFGILLVEYIEYFQQDKTVTSWIGAILLAAMGMMGESMRTVFFRLKFRNINRYHWKPRVFIVTGGTVRCR